MPEPPQLVPVGTKEQQLSSEFPSDVSQYLVAGRTLPYLSVTQSLTTVTVGTLKKIDCNCIFQSIDKH